MTIASARPLIILLLIVFLTACSFPRLMWNFADRMAMSRLDDWLALSGESRTEARARVNDWLESELRAEFLPAYADFVLRFADTAEDGLDADAVAGYFREAESLYQRTLESALPHVAAILARLDVDGRQHLANRMREVNEEYEQEYLLASPAERSAARGERFADQVERWAGSLDAAQRSTIRNEAEALPDTSREWYAYRRDMQNELLRLLAEGRPAERIEAHLTCWWIERCGRPEAHAKRSRALRNGLIDMVAQLDAWLTPEQQRDALRKLRRRADGIAAIATRE